MDISFLKKVDWQFFNWLDILFVLVLIYFAMKYMKRGLVRSLFNIVSVGVSLCLSSFLYPLINNFIKTKTPVYSFCQDLIKHVLDREYNINIKSQALNRFVSDGVIKNSEASLGISHEFLNKITVPELITNKFLSANQLSIGKILNLDALKNYLAGNLANILLSIISIGITFFIISMLLHIINKSFNLIYYLPFLNLVNKWGGIIIGLCYGTLFLWIFCLLSPVFINIPSLKFVKEAFKESRFAIKFYDFNFVLDFISRFIPVLKKK